MGTRCNCDNGGKSNGSCESEASGRGEVGTWRSKAILRFSQCLLYNCQEGSLALNVLPVCLFVIIELYQY